MLSVVAVFVPSFFMTGRVALALRAALARGRLRDDRVVLPLEHAGAGAVGLAPANGHRPRARTGPVGSTGCREPLPSGWFGCGLARRALAGRARLSRRHGRDRRAGRRYARPRDLSAGGVRQFQLRFRAPAGTKFESTERLAQRRARRDQPRPPVRTTWRSRSATSACSRRRTRSTRSSCGPAVRTRACCRWRSTPGRAFGSRTSRKAAADGSANASRRAVLVRARRHRQPDHELRRADPGRGRRHGPGLRREPDVRREGAERAGRHSVACAICSTARRSTIRRSRSTSTVQMAGQLGVTGGPGRPSPAAATSSSRFAVPNYWADPEHRHRASRCRWRCRSRA